MTVQKQQARNLYFQTDMKQADIASLVGIDNKTLYRWIRQENWQRMKEAAAQAPIAIVEMLYKQLHALNSSICERDQPIPTLQEAETNRKLINSIDKIKKQASLSENIQVLMAFTSFLNRIDNDLAKVVVTYADQYLKQKGFEPFGFCEQPEETPDEVVEETKPAHVEQSQKENVPQPVVANANEHSVVAKQQPQQTIPSQPISTPQPQQATTHQQAPKKKFPPLMSPQKQEQIQLQQKAINAFYDEMYRFADKQFKNKNR